jgi:O-antigen ligase
MEINNKFRWIYSAGFCIILILPLLSLPPYFFPPDWGKTIVFRSITAILLFLFIFQLLFRKNEIKLPNFKKNTVFWLLTSLLAIFLLATVFSVDPLLSLWGNPLRSGGVVTFAFYFVLSALAYILFKKDDWKNTWNISIAIGVLVSIGAVIQYYGLFYKIFFAMPGRPSSSLGNPILLAIYLLLLIFLALSLGVKERITWKKVFYFTSAALFSYVILIAGSRAAYLGLGAGTLYFLLFYPIRSTLSSALDVKQKVNNTSTKKIKIIKIATLILLLLSAGFFAYVNTTDQYPNFLNQNKLFNSIAPRLSIKLILNDSRFHAWSGIDYKILLEKPLLGWGPENFSVGFDKYYNPAIPFLGQDWGGWWDKAHNILLDTGAQAGVFALMVYLSIFAALFYNLNKIKRYYSKKAELDLNRYDIATHAIMATLVGYLFANFFSFDSFSSYLIFFLLVAYSMHLIPQNNEQKEAPVQAKQKNKAWKPAVISVLFIFLMVFLWQYNLMPSQVNSKINEAQQLAKGKQCDKALSLMEKTFTQHTFLDSYARLEYVDLTKTCIDFYPENNLAYIKRGLELISEAVKTQPLYTRFWISMGNSATLLAAQEKDVQIKNDLLKKAGNYFDKASQLGPKHQEILVGRTKMAIVEKDYNAAKDYSEKCISLESTLGDCYWYLALTEIYSNDLASAQKNLEKVQNTPKKYEANSIVGLGELSDAYASIFDYKDLALVYQKLVKINPGSAQYHSSLAFIYKELGQYAKARQEALTALQLSPESKPNVDAFLNSLPY